jgi:hypothetical protein
MGSCSEIAGSIFPGDPIRGTGLTTMRFPGLRCMVVCSRHGLIGSMTTSIMPERPSSSWRFLLLTSGDRKLLQLYFLFPFFYMVRAMVVCCGLWLISSLQCNLECGPLSVQLAQTQLYIGLIEGVVKSKLPSGEATFLLFYSAGHGVIVHSTKLYGRLVNE